MAEETNKKLQYLKREEVRTMEKDAARLREQESEVAREKIAQIKTEEETEIEVGRLEQLKKATEERERTELEAKIKEEELIKLRAERAASAVSDAAATAKEGEIKKERLKAQLKESQLKEEEERRKFLENVAAKAEGRGIGQRPLAPPEPPPVPPEPSVRPFFRPIPQPTPPVPPIPPQPTPPIPPPIPQRPTPPIPPSVIEKPVPPPPPAPPPTPPKPEISPIPPAPEKPPFKFPLPAQPPKVQIPKVTLPKVVGYFPTKPSIFEKVWIRVIVSLLIIAILATIVTFWYWYLVVREKSPETPVRSEERETEIIKELTVPLPLIPTESVLTWEIASSEELLNLLSPALKENGLNPGFTRILVKDTVKNKYWGIKEFFEAFLIKAPENFYSNIDNDFTLFIFSSSAKNRLGLIAKSQNPAFLRSIMESWEQTLEKDTSNLFLFLGKGEESSLPFLKSSYKDTIIHYLSFPEENFGICWAITDNYFIFTSSGESIVKAIDKIKE